MQDFRYVGIRDLNDVEREHWRGYDMRVAEFQATVLDKPAIASVPIPATGADSPEILAECEKAVRNAFEDLERTNILAANVKRYLRAEHDPIGEWF